MPRTRKPALARDEQVYGDVKAQQDQMRALPTQQAAPTQTQNFGPQPTVQAPLVSLDAPTQRPDEPLTHGLPSGPGGGPEVLGLPSAVETLGSMLDGLSRDSPAVAQLAAFVRSGRL